MGHKKLISSAHDTEWPDYLQGANSGSVLNTNADAPVVVDMAKSSSEKELSELIKSQPITQVLDSYDEQLAELFLSRDAQLYKANESIQQNSIAELLKKHYGKKPSWKLGSWVYYPWSGKLVHVIEGTLFNQLKTIRNRDLITDKQQAKLAEFRVACLGMSVGSSSALALTLSGISNKIKLVDGAVISGSNLNRVLTGVDNIGVRKSLIIQRKLYEMNPYVQVYSMPGNLAADTLSSLFTVPWKLDLVIDEIDDLEMKIRLRVEAKKRKIPVIMATELADTVMLDVERYDKVADQKLFHGLAGDVERVLDKNDMTQREWMKFATSIIGTKNVPLDMQQSLLKIGSKVVTHPQLGATAMMTGGVLAFAAKQIALGEDLPSMRKSISLEQTFLPGRRTLSHRRKHRKHTKILRRSLGAI